MNPMNPLNPLQARTPAFPTDRRLSVDPPASRSIPILGGTPGQNSQYGSTFNSPFKEFKTGDYQAIAGRIEPYAILPENAIVLSPADKEKVPIELATCLFNSAQHWLISTATHVAEARRQIQIAEMYWKSIVGAETSSGSGSADSSLTMMMHGLLNPAAGSKTQIPHHYALVLREGSVIAGVLGRVPNGEVQAFDPSNEDQVASAEAANRLYTSLLNSINPEGAQLELIRSLWTGATTFIHVHRSQSRYNPKVPVFTFELYKHVIQPGSVTCLDPNCGFSHELVPATQPPPPASDNAPSAPPSEPPSEEKIPDDLVMQFTGGIPDEGDGSQRHVCPQCGQQSLQVMSPIVQVHTIAKELPEYSFPGHSVGISIESMLTITTPVVNCLDEATWLMRRTFQSPAQVLDECEDLKPYWRTLESFGPNAPSNWSMYPYSDPQHTLKNALSEHTVGFKPRTDFWEVTELYMDPREYACLRYDSDTNECGNWLKARFPKGCCLTYVQGRLVKIKAADFHTEFFEVKHDWGSGLYSQPMANPTIAANRVANMMISLLITTVKSGISLKFFRQSKISAEAIRAAAAGVGDLIPVADTVPDMRNLVHQTDSAQMPTGLTDALNFSMESIRQVNGTDDAITGRVNVETTLGGDEMRLNRALMQHHPLWGSIRTAWAKVGQSLVMQALLTTFERQVQQAEQQQQEQGMEMQPEASTLINENIVIGASRGVPTLLRVTKEEQEQAKSGGWFIHIEESIPLSPSQIKSIILQLMNLSPDILQMLVLNDPRNIAKLQEYLLPPGFYTPGKDLMVRIQSMINLLKKEIPPVDPLTGGPVLDPHLGVPAASRPISTIDLDPGACWEQVRAWCQTREASVLRGSGMQPGLHYQNVLNWGYLNKSFVDMQAQMAQQAEMQAQAQAAGQMNGGEGKDGGSGSKNGGGGGSAPAGPQAASEETRPSELLGASQLNAPIPGME